MINQFLHTLNNSFCYWFEHELLTEGQAFRNVSGQLYNYSDRKFSTKYIYGNPYGQFVYDYSISNAYVPSGVYVNGNFMPRGTSGLMIDYDNGRAIFNNPQQNVTAAYAIKDFNIYQTTQPDAKLIFKNRPNFRQKVGYPVTGIEPYANVAPLIYLKRDSSRNDPFAFGGQDVSIVQFRAIIFGADDYSVDGVGSIFTDANRKNFMLITGSALNRYGDITNSNNLTYNYLNEVSGQYNSSNLVWIDDVEFYKFDAEAEVNIDREATLGFLDFTVKIPRYPRI